MENNKLSKAGSMGRCSRPSTREAPFRFDPCEHPRVQHLGVVQPTQLCEVHVQFPQKHNQVTPVVEAMHVVVVVVRHKRLGQRVQRRKFGSTTSISQRVVVLHKFPCPHGFIKNPEKGFVPPKSCLPRRPRAHGTCSSGLNGRKQQVSWCHRQIRGRSVGQHPPGGTNTSMSKTPKAPWPCAA